MPQALSIYEAIDQACRVDHTGAPNRGGVLYLGGKCSRCEQFEDQLIAITAKSAFCTACWGWLHPPGNRD